MNKYEHLNNLIHDKKPVELKVDEGLAPFVMIRQLSSISPQISHYINQTFNRYQDLFREDTQLFYNAMLKCFPKIPRKRSFDFPPVLRETKQDKPTEQEKEVAGNMMISVRELRELLEDKVFAKSIGF